MTPAQIGRRHHSTSVVSSSSTEGRDGGRRGQQNWKTGKAALLQLRKDLKRPPDSSSQGSAQPPTSPERCRPTSGRTIHWSWARIRCPVKRPPPALLLPPFGGRESRPPASCARQPSRSPWPPSSLRHTRGSFYGSGYLST